jgi:hypothetical protein
MTQADLLNGNDGTDRRRRDARPIAASVADGDAPQVSTDLLIEP